MKIFRRAFFAALLTCGFLSTASADLRQLPTGIDGFVTLKLLSAAAVSGPQLTWPGGMGFLDVAGTWNGATMTLQYVSVDGSTLHSAGASCVITSASTYPNCIFYLPKGFLIQATITGAGGSTSLTANAYN